MRQPLPPLGRSSPPNSSDAKLPRAIKQDGIKVGREGREAREDREAVIGGSHVNFPMDAPGHLH